MTVYNPLSMGAASYGHGGQVAFYRGGSGFRTWINNVGNSIGTLPMFGARNRGKSNSHQFYNDVDYLLNRGYTLDQVKSLIGEDGIHDRYVGDVKVKGDNGKSRYLSNTERIWLNRAIAHAQSAGGLREGNRMGISDLWGGYDDHREHYFPDYEDEEPEELEGDVGEYNEEAPEEEPAPAQTSEPAPATPSGPVEAEMPQEQQNPDFGHWQELYDQIQAILNAQQNPEPEPEPEPGVTREDLLGMNRQNIRDFRHGRATTLDNGMRVAPTSRWAGRKIANGVRRNNRY